MADLLTQLQQQSMPERNPDPLLKIPKTQLNQQPQRNPVAARPLKLEPAVKAQPPMDLGQTQQRFPAQSQIQQTNAPGGVTDAVTTTGNFMDTDRAARQRLQADLGINANQIERDAYGNIANRANTFKRQLQELRDEKQQKRDLDARNRLQEIVLRSARDNPASAMEAMQVMDSGILQRMGLTNKQQQRAIENMMRQQELGQQQQYQQGMLQNQAQRLRQEQEQMRGKQQLAQSRLSNDIARSIAADELSIRDQGFRERSAADAQAMREAGHQLAMTQAEQAKRNSMAAQAQQQRQFGLQQQQFEASQNPYSPTNFASFYGLTDQFGKPEERMNQFETLMRLLNPALMQGR